MINKNSRIIITGATGFVGQNLVLDLQNKGYNDISALVRQSSKTTWLKQHNVKLIRADISDFVSLRKINQPFDAIFHCAGYVGNNRKLLKRVNINGTQNACDLAIRLGINRMVYTSSVAVVSGHDDVPLREYLPYKASNAYGESKIDAEKIVLRLRKEKNLNAAIIRPCMIYGESEPHLMRILLFLIKYRLLPLVGAGKNKMHMGYIKNVTAALIHALENDTLLRDSFFIADNEIMTFNEIYGILNRAVGAGKPWHLPKIFAALMIQTPIGGSFFKNRAYSLDRIKKTGFIPPYPAVQSLINSASYFYPKRKNNENTGL